MAEVANKRGDLPDGAAALPRGDGRHCGGGAPRSRRSAGASSTMRRTFSTSAKFAQQRRRPADGRRRPCANTSGLADGWSRSQPDNMKYRMEVQYADTNLGVVLLDQRRFAEAVDAVRQSAASTMEAICDRRSAEQGLSAGESRESWPGSPMPSARSGNLEQAIDACAQRARLRCSIDCLPNAATSSCASRLIAAQRTLGKCLCRERPDGAPRRSTEFAQRSTRPTA